MPLTDAGRDRVLDEWARRLTVDAEVVRGVGTTYVTRADADAVVMVGLSSARVVLGPAPALTLLRATAPARLLELPAVLSLLAPLRARPLGVGTLSYLDVVRDRPTPGVERATDDVVEELRTHSSEDEWAECGLADVNPRWVCRTAGGLPAAVAGHEPWGPHIAQLGVLSHPDHRRHGFALARPHRQRRVPAPRPPAGLRAAGPPARRGAGAPRPGHAVMVSCTEYSEHLTMVRPWPPRRCANPPSWS